jgi:hypothetical protein
MGGKKIIPVNLTVQTALRLTIAVPASQVRRGFFMSGGMTITVIHGKKVNKQRQRGGIL